MKKDLKEVLDNNFANMDLRGWNFKGQNLTGANFAGADLEGACFIDTVLVSANFEGANLKNTDFSCANAWSANFNETNCKDALFLSANLTEASFEGADLDSASFALANLTEANLQDTNIITAEFDNTIGIYPVCPTEGEFTGWTIGEDFKGNDCLVEVSIPTWAQRSSGTTRKCRAEMLFIESIERLKDGYDPIEVTLKNRNYILTENDVVRDNDYEVDRFKASSTDLYFWISKEEALAHARKKI
ncbi:pentapeptide repeat-containing protein [Lachnoanaerobaculum umeaense]|uniref:Pentapeptide repeat-containing protein n=1 Tax=Lachnoanaerobaculum umeaense TaxID=617123 RepID=A0A385Q153_9FIRM|nr:pentapeptide repeat-containing protein [Lachnoanaerobaculum umeaense]AYB00089.1 pentapeptide repeat-containing protein [Lachnoanaerobaculum umeaense]PZW97406.1 pentapeptide repeat protein [Lachnoanaerobaculum umeaense]